MSTEYSNNDNLEDLYKRKFKDFEVEPLPLAFDRINGSLRTSPTMYSSLKSLFSDKTRVVLVISLLINVTLLLWIWNYKKMDDNLLNSTKLIKITKHSKGDSETKIADRPKIFIDKGTQVELGKESIIRSQKIVTRNKGSNVTSNETIENETIVDNEKDSQQSNVAHELIDSVKVIEPSVPAQQDFRSNLEKYSQKKSTVLKDSARELFVPKK